MGNISKILIDIILFLTIAIIYIVLFGITVLLFIYIAILIICL